MFNPTQFGSPQNTFNTMQGQFNPQQLGNALMGINNGQFSAAPSDQNDFHRNPSSSPTTPMPSWVHPQSNMSGKLQPNLNSFHFGLNRSTGM